MIDISIKVRVCYWSELMTRSWKSLSMQKMTETYKQGTAWPRGLDKQKWEKHQVQGQALQQKFLMQAGSSLVGKNSGADRLGSTNAWLGDRVYWQEKEMSLQKALVRSHLKEGIILVTHFEESLLFSCSGLNCPACMSQGTESSC